MTEYCDAKDFKDVNFNMKLLIQKVNHEQSKMNSDMQRTNKKVRNMEQKLDFIHNEIADFVSMGKGMRLMIKIILGVITTFSIIVGIGANFN